MPETQPTNYAGSKSPNQGLINYTPAIDSITDIIADESLHPHFGSAIIQMKQLLKNEKIPMSTGAYSQKIVDDISAKGDSALLHNSVTTSDVILYHPNGNFKIIHDAEFMRHLSETAPLNANGYLTFGGDFQLAETLYHMIPVEEFTRKDLSLHNPLTKIGAKSHKVWNELITDSDLLSQFVDEVYAHGVLNPSGRDYEKHMKIFLPKPDEDHIIACIVNISSIENKLVLSANIPVGDVDNHLIGLDHSTSERSKRNLKHVTKFQEGLGLYDIIKK